MKVYKTEKQVISGQTVTVRTELVLDLTQGVDGDGILEPNTFKLNLDVGDYEIDITNSCDQKVDSYKISIVEAYSFVADVIFKGFTCYNDDSGSVVLEVTGARVFNGGPYDQQIKWELFRWDRHQCGDVIKDNNSTDGVSYQSNDFLTGSSTLFNYGNVNFTVEIQDYPQELTRFILKMQMDVSLKSFTVNKGEAMQVDTTRSLTDLACR